MLTTQTGESKSPKQKPHNVGRVAHPTGSFRKPQMGLIFLSLLYLCFVFILFHLLSLLWVLCYHYPVLSLTGRGFLSAFPSSLWRDTFPRPSKFLQKSIFLSYLNNLFASTVYFFFLYSSSNPPRGHERPVREFPLTSLNFALHLRFKSFLPLLIFRSLHHSATCPHRS